MEIPNFSSSVQLGNQFSEDFPKTSEDFTKLSEYYPKVVHGCAEIRNFSSSVHSIFYSFA